MYYNNCQKQVYHGYDEADEFEHAHAGKRWLKHQMDRLTILPTHNDEEGPVLVHVLGSTWMGLKVTKDKEEQKNLERDVKCMSFSETFEVVKVEGKWKFSRII
jgi:hypothetical protein